MLKNGYVRWMITGLAMMFVAYSIVTFRYQQRGKKAMTTISKIESVIMVDSLRTKKLELRVDTMEVRLGRVEKAVVK